MQTFVYREETSKNNFGGYILFVQSLTLFNRFCLSWDIIGDKLFSNDQDDLDGYLIIGEE